MIEWLHKLDGVEIEEPINFNDIVFNIHRDELWHGIFFEASTTQLGFYGSAFDILQTAKNSYGVDATVIYTADSRCEGETEFTNVISGKLNFSNYQETCGNECIIRMAVEQQSCAMVFKNRFDQKIDFDTPIAFDKITNLVQYPGLGMNLSLATQIIPISSDALVSLDSDTGTINDMVFNSLINSVVMFIRPLYGRVNDNSILTGELDDAFNIFEDPDQFFLLSPQVLLEELPKCINNEFVYDVRMKGEITLNVTVTGALPTIRLRLVLDLWNGQGSHRSNATILADFTITNAITNGVTYQFDQTFAGSTPIPEGWGVYAYIEIAQITPAQTEIDTVYTFDPETSFLLTNSKECPPTDADVYLIHETLSRATESITDRCLTVYSEYYGRVDSEPYSYDADGCGSLRVLTPGLKIRQATDKNFFGSMKEIMEGLRAIDNIGMGMEADRVRIEPAEWFYQDFKMLDILLIPKADTEIQESMIYSNIKSGYEKWEIKSIKGIDEFNSAKEHRTGIKSVTNELNIRSGLIASGYIIENLRTSTLVNTGNTDSTYDNDIFIICVERGGYDYIVEQGIDNGANLFSPATAYNWRIRPLYNLMRWFKSITQCYVNLFSTTSKIFFTSGAGNYLAEGQINPSDTCRLEGGVYPENTDLSYAHFQNSNTWPPIYLPETITFNYPLSVNDYQLIKSNPYGYINVQCGTGDIIKAYIKTLEYKPAEGSADFTLIKKWQ